MPLVRERGLTLLGYSLTNLEDVAGMQLVLPLDRRPGLDVTLDEVRGGRLVLHHPRGVAREGHGLFDAVVAD